MVIILPPNLKSIELDNFKILSWQIHEMEFLYNSAKNYKNSNVNI